MDFLSIRRLFGVPSLLVALCLLPTAVMAQDYTSEFGREQCTFTTAGSNSYFPLWPGYALAFEGEEDDEGELVDISAVITVLPETETVDGVVTRVVEEREEEDGELVEVSRNFMAICRETGDLWYFGEDVDDYEDGEIVGHEGEWRSGIGGARPGVLMPGTPMLGARHYQEFAPGVALDRGEVVSFDESIDVPAGSFDGLLKVEEGSDLDPEDFSEKWYAKGLGMVKDDELELVSVTPPACLPDANTHCLSDGRFKVEAEWEDFDGNEGDGVAILPSGASGEFWFFNSESSELLVKVIDACNLAGFNSYWVFAAGLTNVDVTLTVTDTQTGIEREYENPLGRDFQPVLDSGAFSDCP